MWYIYIYIHTHTVEYYSAIKAAKPCHLQRCGQNLQTVNQSEVSQEEKNKQYNIALRNGTDELTCKAETDTQMYRMNLWIPRGRGEWDELGDWN